MSTQDTIDYASQFKHPPIEDGKWLDAEGDGMRADKVPAYDKKKDKLVRRIIQKALKVSQTLLDLKEMTAQNITTFLDELASNYGREEGGKLGNVTLSTYDRRFKIERSIQKREAVNEKVTILIEMVDECAQRWAKGANKNAQVVMSRYFKRDKEGNYDVRSLRDLKRLPVEDDEQWNVAMELLDDCIDVVSSCTYYRFWVRDDNGGFRSIAMSISDVTSPSLNQDLNGVKREQSNNKPSQI